MGNYYGLEDRQLLWGRMKFSIIFEFQCDDVSPKGERETLLSCVEQAVFAEQMGFDRIWAVEHHSLTHYAHMSAPEIFLTWVAAKRQEYGSAMEWYACQLVTTIRCALQKE